MESDALRLLLANYRQETNISEVARVFFENSYLIEAMGRLLPSTIAPENVRSVLDIGCGSGLWTIDFAEAYPDTDVVGLDLVQPNVPS